MLNPDEIAQAIRDRHYRYHHQAREMSVQPHPLRTWTGDHLVHLGEAIRRRREEEQGERMFYPRLPPA